MAIYPPQQADEDQYPLVINKPLGLYMGQQSAPVDTPQADAPTFAPPSSPVVAFQSYPKRPTYEASKPVPEFEHDNHRAATGALLSAIGALLGGNRNMAGAYGASFLRGQRQQEQQNYQNDLQGWQEDEKLRQMANENAWRQYGADVAQTNQSNQNALTNYQLKRQADMDASNAERQRLDQMYARIDADRDYAIRAGQFQLQQENNPARMAKLNAAINYLSDPRANPQSAEYQSARAAIFGGPIVPAPQNPTQATPPPAEVLPATAPATGASTAPVAGAATAPSPAASLRPAVAPGGVAPVLMPPNTARGVQTITAPRIQIPQAEPGALFLPISPAQRSQLEQDNARLGMSADQFNAEQANRSSEAQSSRDFQASEGDKDRALRSQESLASRQAAIALENLRQRGEMNRLSAQQEFDKTFGRYSTAPGALDARAISEYNTIVKRKQDADKVGRDKKGAVIDPASHDSAVMQSLQAEQLFMARHPEAFQAIYGISPEVAGLANSLAGGSIFPTPTGPILPSSPLPSAGPITPPAQATPTFQAPSKKLPTTVKTKTGRTFTVTPGG